MKRLLAIVLLLFISSLAHVSAQYEDRIKEIKEIFTDYNTNVQEYASFKITHNVGGSEPEMTLFTNNDKKLLVIAKDGHEHGDYEERYYFKNDTIAFIYLNAYRLTRHWGEKPVSFEKLELRFYFDKGKVIKTLRKKFDGIEGKDDQVDMGAIKNEEINYKNDPTWPYFEKRIQNIRTLNTSLHSSFWTSLPLENK